MPPAADILPHSPARRWDMSKSGICSNKTFWQVHLRGGGWRNLIANPRPEPALIELGHEIPTSHNTLLISGIFYTVFHIFTCPLARASRKLSSDRVAKQSPAFFPISGGRRECLCPGHGCVFQTPRWRQESNNAALSKCLEHLGHTW